ncbi:uncharacterized protein Triagg1_2182 [Trichoderma aggressivum f. europaeum]|uniref:Zn(2)-C6 fungal-type domain-containing protein n=1 Tax=Trichoderma aggressivum f. europaeum TaxID=173218 RepID=A0AAE1ILA2_9HYPO|nr:hypothetical protein Triagg1_2182 [Trichoderma aggressivum f. europaeum]
MLLWAGPAFVPICCPPSACVHVTALFVHNLVQPLSTVQPAKEHQNGEPPSQQAERNCNRSRPCSLSRAPLRLRPFWIGSGPAVCGHSDPGRLAGRSSKAPTGSAAAPETLQLGRLAQQRPRTGRDYRCNKVRAAASLAPRLVSSRLSDAAACVPILWAPGRRRHRRSSSYSLVQVRRAPCGWSSRLPTFLLLLLGLDLTERAGQDWTGLGWARLDWTGLDWFSSLARLDSACACRLLRHCHSHPRARSFASAAPSETLLGALDPVETLVSPIVQRVFGCFSSLDVTSAMETAVVSLRSPDVSARVSDVLFPSPVLRATGGTHDASISYGAGWWVAKCIELLSRCVPLLVSESPSLFSSCQTLAHTLPTPPAVRALSRAKRKWAGDGDAASNGTTSAVRPRTRGRVNGPRRGVQRAGPGPSLTDAEYAYAPSSTGSARAATKTQPPMVADLPSPGRVLVHDVPGAIPQPQPQAYPDPQLHTGSLSGHSSVARDCYAGTISRQDNDAMSIAYTTEPSAYSHYSTTSATSSPHFQQNYWLVQGQHGDALGQSHVRQVPSSLPPQSVSLPSTQANGAVYRGHLVSPQQPGQSSQDIGTNLTAPFPPGHSFPPTGFLNHSLVVHYNFQYQPVSVPPPLPPPPPHHFQQCGPHQATGQLPIQTSQGYPYHGPQYNTPHVSADARQLGPPLSTPVQSVGEGSQLPESHHQQAPVNSYLLQRPIRQFSILPTMDSTMYTGPEAEASEVVHVHDDVSYEHRPHMTQGAEWQNPGVYMAGEAHEPDEFGDGTSDASGISDTMDIHCDVHEDSEVQDDSLGTGERPQQLAPSLSMKEEDSASFSVPNRKRGQLSPTHRKQTAETRKIKACTRCRMQKMRCQVDVTDPSGDCVGCKTFSKTSKKTIHRMPCYRGKITDAVLFRNGGLELTKRWKGTEMKDVGDRPNPRDIRTVFITLGICKEEVQIEVVAFRPQSGDVTARFWMDGEQGVRKKKDLAHYCLADIQKTASYFEEYVKRNAVNVAWNEMAGGGDQPGDIIEATYSYAVRRFQLLRRKPSLPGKEERELNLLGNLFILWFAMRHSTGSSWIQGKELLGMKPETRDETYPLYKRVSVPRMILAQFDSINYSRVLTKHGKFVLSELEALMSRNQPEYFFLVYVCLFVLLREASWTSADRYRHARNNHGQSLRYSIPQFVESLHDSCNNLLQHWHYYNAKSWPKPNERGDRFNTHLAHIDATEYDLMMQALTDPAVQKQLDIWRRYKADNGQVNQPAPSNVGGRPYEGRQVFYDWDHPFYWVSQLFEENWQPHATYRAEPVDPLAR